MNLELKHLAPYLPYGLKIFEPVQSKLLALNLTTSYNTSTIGLPFLFEDGNYKHGYGLPALHPLSDLTKEIEVNGERFVPYKELEKELLLEGVVRFGVEPHNKWVGFCIGNNCILPIHDDDGEVLSECSLGIVEKLFEWHFDVFGLIKNGLAIDINTLNLA